MYGDGFSFLRSFKERFRNITGQFSPCDNFLTCKNIEK